MRDELVEFPKGCTTMKITPIPNPSVCDELGIERTGVAPAAEVSSESALRMIFVQSGVMSAADELALRSKIPSVYRTDPVELYSLANACVEPRMGVAIKDGRYVPSTLRGTKQAVENGYTHIQGRDFCIPSRNVQIIEGAALLVGSPVGRNYFHWLFEAIPRWLFARDRIDSDTRILVHELRPMERSALEAAGVPAERLFVLPEDENLLVEKLLVSPRGIQGSSGILPAGVDALRSIVTSSTDEPGERLYVSRCGAFRRRVANEDEVLDILSHYGFRGIQPGELSVEAQAREFARATMILGMHGAGLANAVFAPAGATVIELQPPGLDSGRVALYWNLAAVAGHRCVQVICREADDQEGTKVMDRDMAVDVVQLDRVLGKLLMSPHVI